MAASVEGERPVVTSGDGVRAAVLCPGDGDRAVVTSGDGERAAVMCPGEGERAVVTSVEGELAVVTSVEGELAVVLCSGEGNRAGEVSVEEERSVAVPVDGDREVERSLTYPCTTRLRLRRLLAYLRRDSQWGAYNRVNDVMDTIFHAGRLARHVKAGQWAEAIWYIFRFADYSTSGLEARSLVNFLENLREMNYFAVGRIQTPDVITWFAKLYKHPVLTRYPCFATLLEDVLFKRPDHARAFVDWQVVRNKGAKIAVEMARKTPELRDRMHLPRCRSLLEHIVTIESSFRPRRPVKKLGWKQTAEVAQFYLQIKKRLPSLSQVASHDYSVPEIVPAEPKIALFENALQAGRRQLLKQVHLPKYPSKEGQSSFKVNPLNSQGHRPGHPVLKQSKQEEMWKSHAAVMFSLETTSGMKRSSFQDSHRDTANPRNDSKRPRTTGNFGEDPSSSLRNPICKLYFINEGAS